MGRGIDESHAAAVFVAQRSGLPWWVESGDSVSGLFAKFGIGRTIANALHLIATFGVCEANRLPPAVAHDDAKWSADDNEWLFRTGPKEYRRLAAMCERPAMQAHAAEGFAAMSCPRVLACIERYIVQRNDGVAKRKIGVERPNKPLEPIRSLEHWLVAEFRTSGTYYAEAAVIAETEHKAARAALLAKEREDSNRQREQQVQKQREQDEAARLAAALPRVRTLIAAATDEEIEAGVQFCIDHALNETEQTHFKRFRTANRKQLRAAIEKNTGSTIHDVATAIERLRIRARRERKQGA